MKIARIILAAAVASLGISAHAQEHQAWTVKVPFAFTVGQSHMAAGQYTVHQYNPFFVQLSSTQKSAMLATVPDRHTRPSADSGLVFTKSEGTYTLDRVTNQGSNVEFDASKRAPKPREAAISSQIAEVTVAGTR